MTDRTSDAERDAFAERSGAGDRPASGDPPVVAPYGSWRSAIDVELVGAAGVGLAEPWIDGDDVFWLEARATEAGRRTLVRRTPDGAVHELTPEPLYVGSRVHEYGGGSYVAAGDLVVVSSFPDGRLLRVDREGLLEPVAVTPEGPWRYADLRPDPDPRRARLYAVREDHGRAGEAANVIAAVDLEGPASNGRVLVSGPDFVAAPRPSPDGRRLAWLEWDHPSMPWDGCRLRVAEVREDGSLGEPRTVAGGPEESIVQPEWSPAGVLHFASDRTGWWNLYRLDEAADEHVPVAPLAAEFADPAWVFDRSSYAFAVDGSILAAARHDGRDHLYRLGPGAAPAPAGERSVTHVPLPYTELEGLRAAGDLVVVIGAGTHDAAVLARLDPVTGEPAGVLARSLTMDLDPGLLPEAESIEFSTGDGETARALYFPPSNDRFRGPAGERPPLLVLSHGGPTSNASSALSLDRSFFTSRGIAVVDVDYRGSTGYGRPYRRGLRDRWGIADVEDCVAAATFLAGRGSVDGDRMVIRGGSAGGYTTLAALVFQPEVFAAGISHFGIGDLELIQVDSHKFESRYADSLVAPWPEGRDVYRERSPIHHLDRLQRPLLLFQGLDDRVVPPSQAETIVDALRGRGVPHVALYFEGEGHGFRRADTRRTVLEAELSFLGQVLGFTPADDVERLEIAGLGATGA